MVLERPIGEVFEMRGVNAVVVPDVKGHSGCKICVCYSECWICTPLKSVAGECVGILRSDGISVHFERFNDGRHLTRHLDEGKKSPIATDREQ